jgi:hypothetical protein
MKRGADTVILAAKRALFASRCKADRKVNGHEETDHDTAQG